MKKIILFAVAVLFFVSCEKEMNSGSSGQSSSVLKSYADITNQALLAKDTDEKLKGYDKDKKDFKELKISGSGTLAYTPGGCGAGTLQIKSSGTANSSHLGVLSQVTTICLDPLTGQIVAPVTGVGTSPNGDKLFYTFVGAGIDTATGFLYQDYIFTGGTGKYSSASGSMRLVYSVNTPTEYKYSGTGEIDK